MRNVPAAIQAMLDTEYQTLATCWKVTLKSGAVKGYTSSSADLIIDGVTYLAASGYTPSAIVSNLTLDIDTINVEGVLSSDSITEDELRAGRWDFAEVVIFLVNYKDLSQGKVYERVGRLGQVSMNRGSFTAELRGLTQCYTTSIGSITQAGCRNNLGDRKCQVDLAPFTVTGTVTSASADLFTINDTARTEADDYFTQGIFTVTSGDGAGLSYDVKSYVVGTWVTLLPLAYDPTGATYEMIAGCDRTFATCNTRFSNTLRYNGEPWLRGTDAMMQVGRHNP